ncbi:L-PSP endoribonuclease family protein [Apiospora rasikravindrae]|uniref:L-PSP endoribonuclease family protein n=1 Tax=Apiospora rasikravindrae TaxID=990691 RepID=A0ABR1TAK2_9PEZI
MASSSPETQPPPNGTPYLLPATAAQGLANYPPRPRPPRPPAGHLRLRHLLAARGRHTDAATGTHTLDVRAQTAAVLQNIGTIIRGATDGAVGLEAVVDATVFLTDIAGDYAGMNDEWNKVWPDKAAAPARTCVQVAALPSPKLNVEIKCMALWP